MSGWRAVTRSSPCPACGRGDWCAWTPDGTKLKCERTASPPQGLRLLQAKDGGGVFAADDPRDAIGQVNGRQGIRRTSAGRTPAAPAAAPRTGYAEEAERMKAALDEGRLLALAADLGVAPEALRSVGIGWATRDDLRRHYAGGAGWNEGYPDGAFSFPERDAGGTVVGLSLRAPDGRKGFASGGARRGLVIPATLAEAADPVLVVEGPSDVAAAVTMGLAAVGRPSNTGGAEMLAELLDGRDVLVVGERDQKATGDWPGRKGAKAVAGRLAAEWEEPVRWTLPPKNVKDTRAWLVERVRGGLSTAEAGACRTAGQELLAEFVRGAKEAKAQKAPAQAELLVRLALEQYRLGVTDDGEPFAVRREGPNIALPLRGSRSALRAVLARDYRRQHGCTPNSSALADAMTALEGEALESQPEKVHLRIARHEDSLVLDLGTPDGAAVVIGPGGWAVEAVSPVLFRRTALSAPLPVPERGGSLQDLRELLNVSDGTWPLLLGWTVSGFIPDIAHAILMAGGDQGTGKTTGIKLVAGLFDPSTAPTRCPPKDLEQWAVSASGSWGVLLDNVSAIPEWLADALCRASTGEGLPKRRLFTDAELAVLSFRRIIAITSIDCGALRGDLGDRTVLIDFEPIARRSRRGEKALMELYQQRLPRILGAVLDVVAGVLREQPGVHLDELPRMADFALLLAAMDRAVGTNSLDLFNAQAGRIAQDVVEDDPVGPAMVEFASRLTGEWSGPAKDLFTGITPEKDRPAGWPRSPRALSGKLRRLRPALRSMGVEVLPPGRTDKTRTWRVRLLQDEGPPTARTAQPPAVASGVAADAGGPQGGGGRERPDRPLDRPNETAADEVPAAVVGLSGGQGGAPALLSGQASDQWGEL